MNCPRCRKEMRPYRLDGYLGREVDVDVCLPCQSIWFDTQEHLQLAPGATLALFRVIGENVARPSWQDRDLAYCPQCHAQLRRTQDLQRNTHFEYFRCPNQHGRLTSFFDFLKEKNFVKPLSPQQVVDLKKHLASVNCSNCGAPVDLVANAHCAHCGTPLTMLDFEQAEKLVEQLKADDRTGKPIDPGLPMALALARQQAESVFTRADAGGWRGSGSDLIEDGFRALMRLIRND